jgi:hypothetical protein
MRRLFILLLMLAGLVCQASSASAGAWTRPAGRGFYKLGEQIIRARSYYEPNGNRVGIPALSEYTASLYGEYGLTGRVTLIAYVPFIKRITLNRQVGTPSGFVFFPGDAKTGVADADAGVRVGLLTKGATVLSVQVMLGLPLGDHRQRNGLYTGDGEFNQQVAIQAGRSLYPLPLYIAGEVGLNHRTGAYSDEVRLAFELGCTLRQRWTIIGHLWATESLENGRSAFTGGTGGLAGNNQRYLTYGPEILCRITSHLGITAGVYGAVRGRNVLAAPSFTFGFIVDI